MSRLNNPPPVLHAVALAAALTGVSPLVQAQVTSMLATGSYQLGSDPTQNLASSFPFNNPVDVLQFPFSGSNNAGLHSYGSITGNFGSRSSGFGVYDVTGSFRIEETITNFSAVAQAATFNFFITPGMLSNNIGSALAGTDHVSSGLLFDIRRNGGTVWSSGATLTSNSSGTSFTSSGDASLYAGSGSYYSIAGVSKSVDLGIINAGQSITLSYELDTFARGVSQPGPDRVVPDTTYHVPDQWVSEKCNGYGGYGAPTGALAFYGGGCTPTDPVFVPGHDVVVPGYTVPGTPSGSHASSGDPFTIDLNGNPQFDPSRIGGGPLGSGPSVVLSSVPEPGTYALMLGGLALVGWSARRRRAVT